MLVDTGLGVVSLREELASRELLDREPIAVATHAHFDHVGSLGEFTDRRVHSAEAADLASAADQGSLLRSGTPPEVIESAEQAGYVLDTECFITALPHSGFSVAKYVQPRIEATRLLEEGDHINLGNVIYTVLHLPGHSPGSIALWAPDTGFLFTGDILYDGPLVVGFDPEDGLRYAESLRRIRALDVLLAFPGHGPVLTGEAFKKVIDNSGILDSPGQTPGAWASRRDATSSPQH